MWHFKSAQWRYRFETARNRLVQARSRYAKPHLSRNDAVGQASRLSQTSKNCALRRFLQPPGLAIVQWRQVDCEWRQARRLSYALTTAAVPRSIVFNCAVPDKAGGSGNGLRFGTNRAPPMRPPFPRFNKNQKHLDFFSQQAQTV